MVRILLVDDERGIAEGVQFILEAASSDWEVVGIAEDGQEGIEMAMEYQPDIIITDVRMPVMDGLHMIEQLKKQLPSQPVPVKYVMLSGYSEFEYARQAIGLGVKNYVCKPVEEEELYDVLQKLCEEIARERSRAQQMFTLEQEVENFQKDKRELLLNRILEGQEMADTAVWLDYGFPADVRSVVCVLWEFNGNLEAEDQNLLQLSSSLEKICAGLEGTLDGYARVEIVRCSLNRLAVLAGDYVKIEEPFLVQQMAAVKTEAEELLDMPVSIGIGRFYDRLDKFPVSFQDAIAALHNKVIRGIGSVISYTEIEKNKNAVFLIEEEEIKQLEDYINSGDSVGCRNVIHHIFKRLQSKPGLTLSGLKLQSLNIILSGLRTMPFMQFRLNEYLGKNILTLESISRFHTMEQLENWIINIVCGIMELKEQETSKKRDVITQIKEYIQENYNKELSLNEIARSFYLNPYYLSQLFKKKTGMTYQNYVTSLRVEKAKQLLWEEKHKVYEISEMVGYSDTAYFSKVFEKNVGCRPSEYKKQAMENRTQGYH